MQAKSCLHTYIALCISELEGQKQSMQGEFQNFYINQYKSIFFPIYFWKVVKIGHFRGYNLLIVSRMQVCRLCFSSFTESPPEVSLIVQVNFQRVRREEGRFFIFFKNFLKNYCVERAGAGGLLLLGGMGYFRCCNSQKSALNSIFNVIFHVFRYIFVVEHTKSQVYNNKTNYFYAIFPYFILIFALFYPLSPTLRP